MYDVVGIGHALVDVMAHVPDSFLMQRQLHKTSMLLVEEKQADALYQMLPPTVEISGGSAANTVVGVASFGGKAAFIGKVKNDQLGAIFRHDITASSVAFPAVPTQEGDATGCCIVMVTPDAQRTMCTYLGAAGTITEHDIDVSSIAQAQVVYLEGYLWDRPNAKDAIRKAIAVAKAHQRQVALTLSDSFCVERHREEFLALLTHDVDIVFANQAEILSLFQTQDFQQAVTQAARLCNIAVVTRSSQGSVIFSGVEQHVIEAIPPARLVDTTGAGDLYASGFLYGLTHQYPLAECGRLGTVAATEIISHLGPRSLIPLRSLL